MDRPALKEKNGIDPSIEDLEAPRELNETDTEIPHIMPTFKEDSVQDNTML